MMSARPRLRKALISTITGLLVAAGFWAGYLAGVRDKGPTYRALAVVGEGNSGTNFIWYDVSIAAEAARLRKHEEKLNAVGASYYVANGVVSTTIGVDRPPSKSPR